MDPAGVSASFSNTATSSSSDAAAAPPRAAAAAPAGGRSELSERIEYHLDMVRQLHDEDDSNTAVQLVESSLEIIDSLVLGDTVPFGRMARLHQRSMENACDESIGMRALNHLAQALRAMATSRNHHLTLEAGRRPHQYGLPRRLSFVAGPAESRQGSGPSAALPLFVGGWPPEERVEDLTHSPVCRDSTLEVDLSRVALLMKRRSSVVTAIEAENPQDRVKSEMMSEEEYQLVQERQQKQAAEFEEMERKERMEEMGRTKRRRGRAAKQIVCVHCHALCSNQYTYASHMKFVHPKSPEEHHTSAAAKAAGAEQRVAASSARAAERGRGRNVGAQMESRRPAARRSSSVESCTAAGAANSATAATPATTSKTYTCPMCAATLHSQFTYAAHMRYKHPKTDSERAQGRMKGRRATVGVARPLKDVKEEEPEEEVEGVEGAAAIVNALENDIKREEPEEEEEEITPREPVRRGVKRKIEMKEEEEKRETRAPKSYTCRVCGRLYANYNAVAGHTRHCARRHGISPKKLAAMRLQQVQQPKQQVQLQPALQQQPRKPSPIAKLDLQ